jgi:chemotaxis protein MotB
MKKLAIQRIGFFLTIVLLGSCVSKQKFTDLEGTRDDIQSQLEAAQSQLSDCQDQVADLQSQLQARANELSTAQSNLSTRDAEIKRLTDELNYFKEHNTDLLERLEDFALLTQAGAENVKKSLDNLNEQNKYIRRLTSDIQRKDSLNLALVVNLKRSLSDINDEDVTVEVKKGVVYISISDKLLFRSGSSVINQAAEAVLGKVAKVINDHSNLDVLVEGHTDDVPIATECVVDNWDLSAKRATSVVRMLQTKFSVEPDRMTAGGRSYYVPKDSNETREGRSVNRRTEIILLPNLDEFFSLLTPAGN